MTAKTSRWGAALGPLCLSLLAFSACSDPGLQSRAGAGESIGVARSRIVGLPLLIGDVDGFGYAPTAGLFSASGGPADTDGDGILEPGEFLPDLNRNGSVAVGSNDDFDHRSPGEQTASNGAEWTDRSVTPAGASNGATFTFNFTTPVPGDIDFGVDHFINFVFGDYDVSPATLDVDGQVVPLTLQGAGKDGFIQMASAPVPWALMTDGQVVIKIIAPNEPYLAFDYALLDTHEIADCDGDSIPDPLDNCRCEANRDQLDADGDGAGDICDRCPLAATGASAVSDARDGPDECAGVRLR